MTKINKGFSIVEILIYGALLSIFMLTMLDLFVSSLDLKLESESTSSVEEDGRYVLSRMFYDSVEMDDIIFPVNIGDSSESLQILVGGGTLTYSLDGTDLLLDDGSQSIQLNSNETELSQLSFQRLGNEDGRNSVKVSFVVTSNVTRNKGPEVRSFQTTIGLR